MGKPKETDLSKVAGLQVTRVKSEMTGQILLFEPDGTSRFMRNLKRGDTFVLGTAERHSGEFTVKVNQPTKHQMRVAFVNRNGEDRETNWTYRSNDLCMVVEKEEGA